MNDEPLKAFGVGVTIGVVVASAVVAAGVVPAAVVPGAGEGLVVGAGCTVVVVLVSGTGVVGTAAVVAIVVFDGARSRV